MRIIIILVVLSRKIIRFEMLLESVIYLFSLVRVHVRSIDRRRRLGVYEMCMMHDACAESAITRLVRILAHARVRIIITFFLIF